MNRVRSSFDQKPPLAVSPRRLRPRRGLRSEAAAPRTPPAPSPKETQQLRRSCASEQSPLLTEYEKISRELKALAKRTAGDLPNGDALQAIALAAHVAGDGSSSLFERGRFYDLYSARRNERLKRKMEETAEEEEETPARRSAAVAEAGKRRSTRRMDSVRKSAPESFQAVVGRAPSLRSSLRSSTRESTASSVLRSAVRYNAEGERRSSAQSGRKK